MLNKIFPVCCLVLGAFAFAALIKSPIPPAASGHFVRDTNGDGKADQVGIKFLNPIDSAYLKANVDSVVFSKDMIAADALPKSNMLLLNVHGTNLATDSVLATVYQKGAEPVRLLLADSLKPLPISATVVAGNGMNADTLVVGFSEAVELENGTLKLFTKEGSEKELNYNAVPAISRNLKFVLNRKTAENISASDVVVLEAGVARDLSGNVNARKELHLSGLSPFRIVTNARAAFSPVELRAAPVFESFVAPLGTEFPESRIGMAIDFGNAEFFKALNEELLKNEALETALENVSVRMDMSVYSVSGEYLTSSYMTVKGTDPKVAGGARVFFFWNFMDGHRRVVGSGVYLVRTTMQVYYQGKLVSKDNIGTLHAFGAVRKN